ncbi:hypothetical protein H8E88_33910 [candidate division KSB1 bacterium]|nr:hypothetical protein [candidate division KSB1 bacterium]
MNKKEKIEHEVQKTLECFNQPGQLKSNRFFYTRVKARIEDLENYSRKHKPGELTWGILKPALLFSMVAINIVTAFLFWKNPGDISTSREQIINAFAQEFTLDSKQYNPNLFINE